MVDVPWEVLLGTVVGACLPIILQAFAKRERSGALISQAGEVTAQAISLIDKEAARAAAAIERCREVEAKLAEAERLVEQMRADCESTEAVYREQIAALKLMMRDMEDSE